MFSLIDKLPESYNGCEIKSGFRDILRIMQMLRDPEIRDEDRGWLLCRMFYKGQPPRDALNGYEWFVTCGEPQQESSGQRDFDFGQDAAEIYAAFKQVYHIDLLDEDMHWWQFRALLDGVFATDNALSNLVRLRHADDSETQRKATLERAKMQAAIKGETSVSDAADQQELQRRLMAGEDISDLLQRMR